MMEKRIFKYILEITDKQFIGLPFESKILTIQEKTNEICLWALVDPNETEMEERCFEIFGTGQPIYSDMGVDRKYIATCQTNGGTLVWHIFERLN